MMDNNIDKILAFNREYVASKGYERHITDKFPDKKLAVLSCMDTRLSVLLQDALGLKNGDAKIIKNAGAVHRRGIRPCGASLWPSMSLA